MYSVMLKCVAKFQCSCGGTAEPFPSRADWEWCMCRGAMGVTLSQSQEPHFEVCSCALLGPVGQGQRGGHKVTLGLVLPTTRSPELMQPERTLCCFLGKGWLLPKNRQWTSGRKGLSLLQSSRGGIWTKTFCVLGAGAWEQKRESPEGVQFSCSLNGHL